MKRSELPIAGRLKSWIDDPSWSDPATDPVHKTLVDALVKIQELEREVAALKKAARDDQARENFHAGLRP